MKQIQYCMPSTNALATVLSQTASLDILTTEDLGYHILIQHLWLLTARVPESKCLQNQPSHNSTN
jgi:hypothetical protein